MPRKNKTTKAERLEAKRSTQEAERKERKAEKKLQLERAEQEEENLSVREQLQKRRLELLNKKKTLETEEDEIINFVEKDLDLKILLNARRRIVVLGDHTLSKYWADLRKEIWDCEREITRLFAQLHPHQFMREIHGSVIPGRNTRVLSRLRPEKVWGRKVDWRKKPHELMEQKLKEIRETYPKDTEFAIRLTVGDILPTELLGLVSDYIEFVCCYHSKNGEPLHCDCTKTSKGFILSKEKQKMGDDLKFFVNESILVIQQDWFKDACRISWNVPNPYCQSITGMKIV